jgi:hypothetical protein
VLPWANSGRLVVGDSYFASVKTAIHLHKVLGLRFIGVVKTATRGYPMEYLGIVPLVGGKGSRKGVLSCHEGTQLLAFVWVDRDRRYFIATAGSLKDGAPIERFRWTQVDRDTPNAEPQRIAINVPQPEAAELYYSACGKIDQHNRKRQADLMLEKKMQTNSWHFRVGQSLLGMCIVDAFNLYKGCRGTDESMDQRSFYEKLAEELIDNTYDTLTTRSRKRKAPSSPSATTTSSCDRPHKRLHLTAPTPTKRRKKKNKKHRLQGHCMVCKKHTAYVCRACQILEAPAHAGVNHDNVKQHWICRDKQGWLHCFSAHIADAHPDLVKQEDVLEE